MSKVEEKHALIIAFIELQLHRLKFEEKGELFNIEAIGRRRRFEYKSGLLNIVVEPTIKGDGMVYSLYLRMKTEFCGKEKTMAQAKRTAIVRLVGELENTLREVKQEGVKIFSTHVND